MEAGMTPIILVPILAVALSFVMSLAWVVADRTGNSAWVDAIWSLAVGGASFVGALVPLASFDPPPRSWLVAALAGLWSIRLGIHIASRARKGGDDPRYARLRVEWGPSHRRKFFWFLQVQAVVALVLACSVIAAAHNPAAFPRLGDWLGAALLLVAIGGEALADRQLKAFRASSSNRNRVCDIGLWGFSRHPNYFFEWLAWLAYLPIAIDSAGYPWGCFTLLAPLMMYWLLVHASGIPPLEAHMRRSRGQAFAAYQARVNAFWPGPPKTRGPAFEEKTR